MSQPHSWQGRLSSSQLPPGFPLLTGSAPSPRPLPVLPLFEPLYVYPSLPWVPTSVRLGLYFWACLSLSLDLSVSLCLALCLSWFVPPLDISPCLSFHPTFCLGPCLGILCLWASPGPPPTL